MKKDDLLLTASFVTKMHRKEHCTEEGKLFQFWKRVEHEIREIAAEFDLSVECYGSSVYALGAGREPDNSGRCCICREWVSAQNRLEVISELWIGAEYRDALYCLEHLPKDSDMYPRLHGPIEP